MTLTADLCRAAFPPNFIDLPLFPDRSSIDSHSSERRPSINGTVRSSRDAARCSDRYFDTRTKFHFYTSILIRGNVRRTSFRARLIGFEVPQEFYAHVDPRRCIFQRKRLHCRKLTVRRMSFSLQLPELTWGMTRVMVHPV